MTQPLRIGFIGAGGIVEQRHLPGLREVEGVTFTAVANSTLDSAQAFCRKHLPEAQPLGDWRAVAGREDVDIVWIGATPYLHAPATLAALEAGKHVFCQARMARNLSEAESMLAEARKRPEQVTMLCPPPQGLRQDAFMRRLLAEDVVGPIRSIRVDSFNGMFLDPAKPIHWRQRREISGNNILTLGIHTEVLQRWFGDLRVTSAQGKIFIPRRGNDVVDIPDVVTVLAEFENGALGRLDFSGLHSGEPVERLEVVGVRGVLVYDYAADVISLRRAGSEKSEVLTPREDEVRDWAVEKDFVEAVRHPENPRPHPNFEDGVRYMRVVDEVQRVLQRG